MSFNSDLMRRLSQIDMPAEALREVLGIIADLTSTDDSRRAKDRARKRKVRGKSADASMDVSAECPVEDPAPSSPQRDIKPPTNPDPSELRSDKTARADAKTILAEVLPEETAAELIAHRKAKRSPITAGSARGLVKAFVAYGNPVAAAEAMMTHGWQGFKPEWMGEGRQARAGPARSQNGGGRSVSELAAMDLDEPDIFDDQHGTDTRNGASESANTADETRSGFAGRLSEPASHAARRGALIDH